MVKPYSDDLRERVAGSVASGRSCRDTASLFGVSVASVVRWSQRHRAMGTAAAFAMGRKPQGRRLERHRDWLLERLATTPHVTLRNLALELRERGVAASHVSVWRVLKEAGFSFKKNAIRRRAGSSGHRPSSRPMEKVSGKA